MGRKDLQCLFIGKKPHLYTGLLDIINEFNFNLRVKKIDENKSDIISSLKSIKSVGIVFISDQTSFPIYNLSDLIWQYSQDTVVIILTEKMPSVFFKNPLNNIVLARLNIKEINNESQLFLGSLLHITQIKRDFRQCKSLLGVSEKRCQWLVDSSNEAIAYISRDLHLYANSIYLDLFEIESIQSLRSISVHDLIANDEHASFDDFVKVQSKLFKSLLISMRKRNGKMIRARVMTIPSVIKGEKCLQLWVRPIQEYKSDQEQIEESSISKMESLMSQQEQRRQSTYQDNYTSNTLSQQEEVTTSLEVLKGVIKRKEVKLSSQQLADMRLQGTNSNHHYLTLKTPKSLKSGIEKLLFYPVTKESGIEQTIFWDKVKFVRLLQFLNKRKQSNTNIIIRFNVVSASNEIFARWFTANLKKVVDKTSNIIFLFPIELDRDQRNKSLGFVDELKKLGCTIALDDFSASKGSMTMLKKAKPDYVRLSSSWIKTIDGNDAREIALASFIRQIESKNIKIIAPCEINESLRRLFILSGVSFCQEKVIKAG